MNELPKRWPLITQPGNRYSDVRQDGRLVNCYGEKDPQYNEYDVVRRPALRPNATLSALTTDSLGIFNWQPTPGFDYTVQARKNGFDASIFLNTSGHGSITGGGSVFYDFEPIASATPGLFIKATGFGYVATTTTLTQVTDPVWSSFEGSLLPGVASLNGRLYVLASPNRVYGATNLNDGEEWSALNLILANDTPSWGTFITRYLEYILVMKTDSTEVFRDEGNPTGSPLGKVPGISIPYGCIHPRCVVRINDALIWPATSRNSSQSTEAIQVVMMEGLTAHPVSTPKVDRLLSTYTPTSAYPLLVSGHKFYCVELYTDPGYLTLVYDLTENLWSEWYWPTSIVGASDGPQGLLLQPASGACLEVHPEHSYDILASDPIALPYEIYTPNMDFGSDWQKTLHALYFTGDQTKGTQLKVRRSDDDYKTWSNFRTVDLGSKKPRLADEGSFYRRAYHLRFDQMGPMRMRALGMALDLGMM